MIKKIITQIKSVSLIGIVAVTLASGVAVAKTHHSKNLLKAHQADVLWGRHSDGSWTETTAGASCTTDTSPCKELFPSGQDPNDDPTGGTVTQANGHIN